MGTARLAPLESKALASQVEARLEEAIHAGQLAPGQRLIETELAAALLVSRASVREALRLLQSKGLVVSNHRRGTYVAEITAADVREIYTLRILLETYAIRLATEHVEAEAIDGWQHLVDDLSDAARQRQHRRIVDVDLRFHQDLCAFTGNRRLLETWRGLVSQLRALLLTKYRLYDDSPEIAAGHQRLVDAIRAGDPEQAEVLLKAHIIDTAEQVLRALNDGEPPVVVDANAPFLRLV